MTKENFFKRLISKLKEELSLNDNFFVYTLICCGLIVASIVLSFFIDAFYYITALLAVSSFMFINFISKKNYYSLYILAFLFPFSMVMSLPKLSIGIYPILAAIQGLILIMDVLFKFQKKQIKLNFWIVIPSVIFCLYVLLLWFFGWFGVTSLISVCVGMVLLVAIYHLREEISFKKVGLCLIIGLLIMCFLGIFYKHYPTLSGYFDVTYALNKYRFSGLYKNTNGLTFVTLFVVSVLMTMYLKRDITILFYPFFTALISVLIATISKMAFVVLAIEVVLLIFCRLIINRKVKGGWESTLCIILCLILSIGIQFNNFKIIMQRIVDPFQSTTSVTVPDQSVDKDDSSKNDSSKNDSSSKEQSSQSSIIDNFTTGRMELNKRYIKEVLESGKTVFFGINIGSDYNIGDHFSGEGSHNTYVDILYHLGFVGFVLIAWILLTMFISIAKRKFNIWGVFVLIIIAICFACASSFSYVGFLYLCMAWLACTNQIEKGDKANDSKNN